MKDITISVKNIGKRYHLGSGRKYDTLRDALMGSLRHEAESSAGAAQTIWALKDVSFEIRSGEVVGIIGRNGAGKSTLLKILSRITEPSSGQAEIHGRVGSLLEVGTGFHPELTGRENIYLNGAILGMRRTEIDRKFDEIVAFSEIEKFLDTPVKRYSSGMYVRLAFAVAAHLEPEILLVDEVLAVGDAAFQKKCLGKMGDVAQEGRTVLFVSHNMAAMQALSSRGILLNDGRVTAEDVIEEVVKAYLRTLDSSVEVDLASRLERRGAGGIRLLQVQIFSDDSNPTVSLVTGGPASFVFQVSQVSSGLSCSFTVYDIHGQMIANFNSAIVGQEDRQSVSGDRYLICKVKELCLVPGRYRINVAIARNGILEDHVEAAAFFQVEPGLLQGRPVAHSTGYGSVCIPHRWITPV